MEGTYFTVEQAARIMSRDRATIYRLLDEGLLERPIGGSNEETAGRVTERSLFQLMVVNRIRCLSPRALKELKRGRKYFEKSESQMEEAKHLSIYEGTSKADPDKPTAGQSLPPTQCLNHEYAEQHQFSFGWKARQLAPDDPALQDDLIQEMSLAVLEYRHPASSEFLFELATNAAKMYLRHEACRGMHSLKKVRHTRDSAADKLASLNRCVEKLLERGVPAKWIAEVIGRLHAA